MHTITITGCSTGFGRVTTRRFLREGWRVIATVRQDADGLSLKDEARGLGAADRLTVVRADITDPAGVAALGEAVRRDAPALNALVNNAGTAFPSVVELLPIADLRAQLEVNVVAHVAVTQALLPFLKTARGTLINVSSVSGRIAVPGVGAYCASKFALEAISDSLRVEVAPFGVRVVIVEPASSPTAIWKTSRDRLERGGDAGEYGPLLERLRRYIQNQEGQGFPPELFAETIWRIAGAASPSTRYAIPAGMGRMMWLRRLLPDAIFDRQVRRALNW